jgi:hypothetical protein
MSNFSDFFPAPGGGGGGGFTKRLKYTTARGASDADYNNASSYTVNPATDLGLEDGALMWVFMVSGGYMGELDTSYCYGGNGGLILSKTVTITTASTNLVLTPGVAAWVRRNQGSTINNVPPTASTISGGLTLTTASGNNFAGRGGPLSLYNQGNPMPGINGYGGGGGPGNKDDIPLGVQGSDNHGFGTGALGVSISTGENFYTYASDGAILLYY